MRLISEIGQILDYERPALHRRHANTDDWIRPIISWTCSAFFLIRQNARLLFNEWASAVA